MRVVQQTTDRRRDTDDARLMETRLTLVVSDLRAGQILAASGPLTVEELVPLQPFLVQLATSRRARRGSMVTSTSLPTFVAPREMLPTPTVCRLVSVDLDRQVALWELESRPGPAPASAVTPRSATATAKAKATNDPGDPPSRRIICIDNDPDGVDMLRLTLAFLPNIQFLSAATGRAGLALLHERRPSLLLVDVQLPDVSGAMIIEYCRRSIALASVPLIVLTADASKSTRRIIEALGVTHLAVKPFDLVELREFVDRLLPAV